MTFSKVVKKHRCVLAFIISGVVWLTIEYLINRPWGDPLFRHLGSPLMMGFISANAFAEVFLNEFEKTHPDAKEEIKHNPYHARTFYSRIWKNLFVKWIIAIFLFVFILLGPIYLYLWYHKIDDNFILFDIFAIEFFSLVIVVLILEFYRTIHFCEKADQILSKST